MEPKNKYTINGQSFTLKEDLTLREIKKVNDLLRKTSFDGSTIEINTDVEGLAELLSIILIPESKLPEGFDFGDTPEKLYAAVIMDFFDMRMKLSAELQSSMLRLMNVSNSQSTPIIS